MRAPAGQLDRLWRRTARAAAAVALACGVSSTDVYEVEGEVLGVDAGAWTVRIAHDDIPGFMPAMTMSFDVASPELLEGVTAGARVRFTLERSATELEIVALEMLEPGAAGSSGALSSDPSSDLPQEAPAFRLVDHDGETLELSELRGRAVLLDFIFTRCAGPCPILTSAHVALQRRLPAAIAERTHFLSVSIDPGYDTPERLREYASARGADLSRWSFLTGEFGDVQRVLSRYHVGTARQPDGTLDHVVATFLIDPQGQIVRRYLGLRHAPEELLTDLEEVLS